MRGKPRVSLRLPNSARWHGTPLILALGLYNSTESKAPTLWMPCATAARRKTLHNSFDWFRLGQPCRESPLSTTSVHGTPHPPNASAAAAARGVGALAAARSPALSKPGSAKRLALQRAKLLKAKSPARVAAEAGMYVAGCTRHAWGFCCTPCTKASHACSRSAPRSGTARLPARTPRPASAAVSKCVCFVFVPWP